MERDRGDYDSSPFSFRSVIQLVATIVALVLIGSGLVMAYGVFRLVQETLLSPENFVRIVDAWAEPVRGSLDDAAVERRLPVAAEQPAPALADEPLGGAAMPSDEATSSDDEVAEAADRREVERPKRGPAAGTTDDVDPDTGELADRESVEAAVVDESGDDAASSEDHGDPLPMDAAPDPAPVAPAPHDLELGEASPFEFLDRFLTALKEQDLGRAAAGFLVFLFLIVLVKIPIALLTIGGNLLSSVLKSSQPIVTRPRNPASGSRKVKRDESASPLNVGDLT